MITYQFRLYPNKYQQRQILKQLESHRLLYNQCLDKKINTYKDGGKSLSTFDQIKSEVKDFKGMSNCSSLQQTVRRLGKTFDSFFKQANKGFPRFRSKNRFRTIEYARHGDGCKLNIDEKFVYIQHVGNIKCKVHRKIDDNHKIKTLSITHSNGEFYANIICESFNGITPQRNTSIGLDPGISTTLTTSDGQKFKSPYFYKPKQKEIGKLQRKKNYKSLNKVCTKIRNKRKDFNHKLSKQIVDQYDIICIEDLKIKKITSYKDVNKRLFDVGINQLINFIKYKAEKAGKLVVMVNPKHTTQTCLNCKKLNTLTLKQRTYKCDCGYTEDRDINAAKNILAHGLMSLDNLS